MVWWISGGVVAVSLLVLAAVMLSLRSRLAGLARAAADAERAARSGPSPAAVARLRATLEGLAATSPPAGGDGANP